MMTSGSSTAHARACTVFDEKAMDRIRFMVAADYKTEAIAHALGTTVDSLRRTCADLRVSLRGPSDNPGGRRLDPFRPPLRIVDTIKLNPSFEARSKLAEEAALRGVSLGDLCVHLLEIIANDGLVKSIIDD